MPTPNRRLLRVLTANRQRLQSGLDVSRFSALGKCGMELVHLWSEAALRGMVLSVPTHGEELVVRLEITKEPTS